jgi:hypothetical protein
LGLPHTSRQPKAIAGDGFYANACADVYNLYVTKKYICEACIFLVGNSFTVLWIVDLSTIKTYQESCYNRDYTPGDVRGQQTA